MNTLDYVALATVGLAAVLLIWTILVRTETLTAEHLFGTKPAPPRPVSPQAKTLHSRLVVADLHADSLMWRRDLLRKSKIGQFDFPRMQDGGVAVQGFLVVTEAPKVTEGGNISDKTDRLTALGIFDQWPLPAILDQTERALYIGGKLQEFANRSNNRIRVVKTASELNSALAARARGEDVRAVYLGLEGGDGTKFQIANLERLFKAGFRMAELCHYTDTSFAASSSGVSGGGLTALGKEAIAEMNRIGMMVDLAHASPKTIEDVLKLAKKPPLITHCGSGSCHHDPKCIPDEILKEVVRRGGVVGLGFVSDYVGGKHFNDIIHALEHMIGVLGPQGVALGSGFCALPQPIAVDSLPSITDELLKRGHSEDVIRDVMGGNVVRYLRNTLPA